MRRPCLRYTPKSLRPHSFRVPPGARLGEKSMRDLEPSLAARGIGHEARELPAAPEGEGRGDVAAQGKTGVSDTTTLCQRRIDSVGSPAYPSYGPDASSINFRSSVRYGVGCVTTAVTYLLARMGGGWFARIGFRKPFHTFRNALGRIAVQIGFHAIRKLCVQVGLGDHLLRPGDLPASHLYRAKIHRRGGGGWDGVAILRGGPSFRTF